MNELTKKPVSERKKVVVGFTGRLDSLVASYLLKKQGFQVYAVAVNFSPREPEMILKDPEDDESEKVEAPFFGVDLLSDLSEVKKVAQAIGLNFYAVDASDEYKNMVTDTLVASRVAGLSFTPEICSHALLLKILAKKCDVLGAANLATGHFAKISSLEGKSPLKVLSSNDLSFDQSDLLAFATQGVLSKLMLPLADMRKVEVKKVAASLKLSILPEKVSWQSMQLSSEFKGFIKRRMPLSMIKEGQVIDFNSERIIGDHEGIHQYFVGQANVKLPGIGSVDTGSLVASIQYSSGSIVMLKPEEVSVTNIYLSNLKHNLSEDLSRPLTLYLKRVCRKNKVKGVFYFKNNGHGEFILDKPHTELIGRGETLTFYAHAKEGARLVLSASVVMAGQIVKHKLSVLPQKEDDFIREDDHDKPLADFVY